MQAVEAVLPRPRWPAMGFVMWCRFGLFIVSWRQLPARAVNEHVQPELMHAWGGEYGCARRRHLRAGAREEEGGARVAAVQEACARGAKGQAAERSGVQIVAWERLRTTYLSSRRILLVALSTIRTSPPPTQAALSTLVPPYNRLSLVPLF